jgi:hypothetical protein
MRVSPNATNHFATNCKRSVRSCKQARQGDTFNESLATQKLTEMASLEAKLMAEEFKLHQDTLAI